METIYLPFLIIFFLSIGSFSSVIIYRLNLIAFTNARVNLFFPRSYCPSCKRNISIIYLIPLVGFLLQKGKCIHCNSSISFLYPLHELIHLLVGVSIYLIFNISIFSIFIYALFSIFYILFICDLQKLYLPFYLNLSISIIGLLSAYYGNIFYIDNFYVDDISQFTLSLSGFITGYLILWLINTIYKSLKKVDGIGGGDFILLAGIGSLVGPFAIAPIIFFGSLSTIFLVLVTRFKLTKTLPLGSGLIIGLFIYLFLKFYELSLFGLVI